VEASEAALAGYLNGSANQSAWNHLLPSHKVSVTARDSQTGNMRWRRCEMVSTQSRSCGGGRPALPTVRTGTARTDALGTAILECGRRSAARLEALGNALPTDERGAAPRRQAGHARTSEQGDAEVLPHDRELLGVAGQEAFLPGQHVLGQGLEHGRFHLREALHGL